MDEYFDLVIIGGGPAGLAAGIYGGRARLKTLILEKGNIGGRVYTTREIVNYPSVEQSTGPDLMEKMRQHALDFGVEIRQQQVKAVDLSCNEKLIQVRKTTYHAKAVIIATGTSERILGIPGEREFTGAGVSYCATCDAAFYEGEHVVVLGSGDQAVEESEFIAKFADKVTIIVVHDEGILDCNQMSADRAMKNPKLNFVWNSTIAEVYGEDAVEGVKIKNVQTGEITDMPCGGVFFFVGTVPATDFLEGIVQLAYGGWIETSDDCKTNLCGVYAAGDVRKKYLRQVATAVGDGATAATAAERYIAEMEQFKHDVEESEEPVLVGFWNSQIPGSMDMLAAIRENNSKSENPLRFVELDVSRKKSIAQEYGIRLNDQNRAEAVRMGGKKAEEQ